MLPRKHLSITCSTILFSSLLILGSYPELQATSSKELKSDSYTESFQKMKKNVMEQVKKVGYQLLSGKKKAQVISRLQFQRDPARIGIPLIALQYGRNQLEEGASFPRSTRSVPFQSSELSQEKKKVFLGLAHHMKPDPFDLGNLAKKALLLLASGDEEAIAEANTLLLGMDKGASFMGTDLFKKLLPDAIQSKTGGYDFVTTTLIPILYLFGSEGEQTLTAAAQKHLLTNLLRLNDEFGKIVDLKPGQFTLSAPYLQGLVEESENHALMIYSTLYLLSQYHYKVQGFDRSSAIFFIIEQKLTDYLRYINTRGFHEFNSHPYVGITFLPLLSLDSFASGVVKDLARNLLDRMSYQWALGSFNGKFYAPFCRHEKMVNVSSLESNHQAKFMRAWSDGIVAEKNSIYHLQALLFSYRPSEQVFSLAREKNTSYYAQMGHGQRGSCEIFWAQPGLLLSAGGSKGRLADHRVVMRPICLMLDDGADDISETIHLGRHNQCQKTNGSGVYKNFACSAKELYLGKYSAMLEEETEKGKWMLIHLTDDLYVIAYTEKAVPFSLLTVFSEKDLLSKDASVYFSMVQESNAGNIRHAFTFPESGARIEYDVHAPRDYWVIRNVQDPSPISEESRITMKENLSVWSQLGVDVDSTPLH